MLTIEFRYIMRDSRKKLGKSLHGRLFLKGRIIGLLTGTGERRSINNPVVFCLS